MTSDRDILNIVELMWDATTDVDKWETVMRRVSEAFDSQYAKMSYFNVHNRDVSFTASYNLPLVEEPLYIELVKDHQDLLEPYVLKYPGRAFHCRMFHTDEQVRGSLMYRKLLGPSRYEYRMGFVYPQEDFVVSLGLMRGPESRSYTAEDCERMALLAPHLKQATRLHAKFAEIDLTGSSTDAVLDRVPIGIVVTGRSGEIAFANAFARELLGREDGLAATPGNALSASDAAASRELSRLIARAVDEAEAGIQGPGQGLPVPRRPGHAPLSLLIAPLWSNIGRYRLSPLDRPMAVVFITDPERRSQAPAEVLQTLFGLTAAEARVLEQLVLGLSLAEIAAVLGKGEETIRSQLKSILHKTATHRQADLIALVMSSAAWLAATA